MNASILTKMGSTLVQSLQHRLKPEVMVTEGNGMINAVAYETRFKRDEFSQQTKKKRNITRKEWLVKGRMRESINKNDPSNPGTD